MKGVYVLLIELKDSAEIEVGKLGTVEFEPGTYAYVGSGMGGIEARVARHLRMRKKVRWHIDHLLAHPEAQVAAVYAREAGERLECWVAQALAAEFRAVPGFGSSDCRCPSHLFRGEPERLRDRLGSLGLEPFRAAPGPKYPDGIERPPPP